MTAKEKAQELVGKMDIAAKIIHSDYLSRQHASLAVEEIINNVLCGDGSTLSLEYWEDVKEEIKKL